MNKKVYPNQKNAASEIFNQYNQTGNQRQTPVLLIAQPQAGKTSTVVESLRLMIGPSVSEDDQATAAVFWMGPSDSALKEQSNVEIKKQSKTVSNCLINYSTYHSPDFRGDSINSDKIVEEYNLARTGELKRFIVLDEAHVGIGKKQTVPEILKSKFGFFPGIGEAEKGVFTMLVTATPGTHLNYSGGEYAKNQPRRFIYCYLKPGDDYTSLSSLRDSGRMNDTFRVDSPESKNRFLKEVLNPFLDNSPKHLIIRLYDSTDTLAKFIQENISLGYDVKLYDSKANKNISELSSDLEKTPNKHKVCLIVDSYLQGKTFNVQNIGGWFDRSSPTSHATFTVQSVGRNCGYGRKHLTYPIWTNIEHVDDAIAFYKYAELADWNKIEEEYFETTHLRIKKRDSQERIYHPRPFDNEELAEAFCVAHNWGPGATWTSHVLSKNTTINNDWAQAIVNGNVRQWHEEKNQMAAIIHVDKAAPDLQSSWDNLMLKYPEYQGKYIVVFKTGRIKHNKVSKDTSIYAKVNNSAINNSIIY